MKPILIKVHEIGSEPTCLEAEGQLGMEMVEGAREIGSEPTRREEANETGLDKVCKIGSEPNHVKVREIG